MQNFQSVKGDKLVIEDRIKRITSRSIKKKTKIQGLKMLLNMLYLTTFDGMDTANKVNQLCNKVQHLHKQIDNIPKVVAVCVYPNFIKTAVRVLLGSGINVISVATGFPSENPYIVTNFMETKTTWHPIENISDSENMY